MFHNRYQLLFSILLLFAICGPMVNSLTFFDGDKSYLELLNEEENNEQETENTSFKNMFLVEPQQELDGFQFKSILNNIPFHRSAAVNCSLEVVLPPPELI